MKWPGRLGRHLHNQIVLPLMGAALFVAVVATAVAVLLLSQLTGQWVDSSAEAASRSLESRLGYAAGNMAAEAKLIADDVRLAERLRSDDPAAVSAFLALANSSVKADGLMILDPDGIVIASTGARLPVRYGDRPLGYERDSSRPRLGSVVFARVGGVDTVTGLQPVVIGERTYTLALSRALDDKLLAEISEGSSGSFGLYDTYGRSLAVLVGRGPSELPGGPLRQPDAAIERSLADARKTGQGLARPTVGSSDYHVLSRPIALPGDPGGRSVYLVTAMSSEMTDQARATTTRLIAMWSFFAVLLLVGFGAWIARSVSTPLTALAEGARKVADGDFTTKVQVSGANEIHALAESFNLMTDSLRERTESLTKKVLELATLYEMSRSLGATLDLDALLDSVLESAMRIFNVESGYVSLRDKESGALVIRAKRGQNLATSDSTALRSSMAEWVAREGRPLIFNPPGDGQNRQVDSVTGALAALAAPMSTSDGVIGAITVGTHDENTRFTGDDVRLLQTISNQISMAIGNIELFAGLQEAYLATVRALAAAVDAKDSYTRGHSDGVALFSTRTGREMGLSTEQQTALEIAAYLHDIGKIGIREEILLKPGRLSEDEMGQMRHHPLIGANILKPIAFPWPIAPVVRHHHEHWDGRGYPAGLKSEEIPLLARILSVADAYEAMISDRPYRRGRSPQEALAELRRCSGTQFDPRVVEAFDAALESLALKGEVVGRAANEVPRDEARAIFVAICDGMLDSYRRLGGPRLASNLEMDLNDSYSEEKSPFHVAGGRLTAHWDDSMRPELEVELMRFALTRLEKAMEGTSGRSLVDHFYEEALAGLSERMRRVASDLDLRASAL